MKDLTTGAQLIKGRANDGGYEWPHRKSTIPSVFSTSIKRHMSIWHSKLGHHAFSILKIIISHSSLPVSNNLSSLHCNDCLINKSHKMPFSVSSLSSTKPLELVFFNVWTSPVMSIDGYKYYIFL